ncbi:MAG TPA: FecR domain-containing protein [Puia sp.]|jgi:ferric-dicitrate binding protein FerR (iron transport regulator)
MDGGTRNEGQLQDLFRKYLDETLTQDEFIRLYALVRAGHDPGALDALIADVLTNPVYAVNATDYDKKEVFASLLAKIEGMEPAEVGGEEMVPVDGEEREGMRLVDGEEREGMRLVEGEEREGKVIGEGEREGKVVPFFRRGWAVAGAAAVVVLLAGSIYLMLNKKNVPVDLAVEKKEIRFDAPPGRSGAILTLANGQQMELDNVQNGRLARQGDAQLLKEGGRLSYRADGSAVGSGAGTGEAGAGTDGRKDAAGAGRDGAPGATAGHVAGGDAGAGTAGRDGAAGAGTASRDATAGSPVLYNSITTPRGRQFELVLSDGTRVSLNAASTIRFPTSFAGKDRRVEVTGEAYFEVARNEKTPFIVTINKAEVVVLGTHFDVSNYDDENNINATLLEGSIKMGPVSGQVLLAPGEQARLDRASGALSRKKVDVDQVVAWTKGRLAISNSDLPALMRQISRWYDVDVVLPAVIPNVRIGGFLHRDVNLSTVLGYLEENGVHYKAEGKTITILP